MWVFRYLCNSVVPPTESMRTCHFTSSQEFRVTDAVEGFRLLAYDITV